jgi:pseudouridine kinase
MNTDRPVLVIGASGIDIKARASGPVQMATFNPGTVRNSVGGVARNIAENLARLEVPTILLSAVGDDATGDFLLARTAEAGVDTSHVLHIPDTQTGSYVAILDPDGQLRLSVGEYDIVDAIAPRYLQTNRGLFAEAAMVVIDANLSERALASVFLWADRYQVPVCADPTSQMLAPKLIDYLPHLHLVTPDAAEAAVLCQAGDPPTTSQTAIQTAQCLASRGANIAIVTLAEQGLAYAGGNSAGHIPALRTQVVDTTGVGDALTAAVIFGLVNDMPLDEAIRLGISASALTLQTRETVAPDLSLDRIYDELVV